MAQSILALIDGDSTKWRKGIGLTWAIFLGLIGAAPWAIHFTEYRDLWNNSLGVMSVWLLSCAAYTLWKSIYSDGRAVARQVAVQGATLLFCLSMVAFPLINSLKSAKSFCEPMRSLSEKETLYTLYSLVFSREEFAYYAEHFHERFPPKLVYVEEMKNIPDAQQAVEQRGMLYRMGIAVKHVPIDSMETLDEETVQAFRTALDNSLPEVSEYRSKTIAYRTVVIELLETLMTTETTNAPTFIITQENDWRWVVALCSNTRNYTIIKNEHVGNRHVLLLANQAALEKLH